MTAQDLAEWSRWYAQIRAALPWLPETRVTDDLDPANSTAIGGSATAMVMGYEADGRVWVRIRTDPGQAIVYHETGHIIQAYQHRIMDGMKLASPGDFLSAKWAAMVREHRIIETSGPSGEGFAALVCEAYSGMPGGYWRDPDESTVMARLQEWYRSPKGEAARQAIAALRIWGPSQAEYDAAAIRTDGMGIAHDPQSRTYRRWDRIWNLHPEAIVLGTEIGEWAADLIALQPTSRVSAATFRRVAGEMQAEMDRLR